MFKSSERFLKIASRCLLITQDTLHIPQWKNLGQFKERKETMEMMCRVPADLRDIKALTESVIEAAVENPWTST